MFDTFNLLTEIRLFEILKMFYPMKGLYEAEPEWGLFDSFHFIVSIEGCLAPSIYERSPQVTLILSILCG